LAPPAGDLTNAEPGRPPDHDLVIVIDYGAQYAQLIARRVREASVYSEIMPHTASVEQVLARQPAAIILSGGPQSVYAPGAPQVDAALFDAGEFADAVKSLTRAAELAPADASIRANLEEAVLSCS